MTEINNGNKYNGIVNIYKPLGITSFKVVAAVRRICGVKKVGHTGTLDPEAEGVLPVCIGNATKAADMLTAADKKYRAKIRLGVVTDTQDMQGEILEKNEPCVTEEEFKKEVESFVGEISQLPPMYSALKVDGKKLCDLARKGIEVERKPRKITVFSIDVSEFKGDTAILDVACSKGTYIRTLCHDIGQRLGCGAAMETLVRTKSGVFEIEKSVSLEEFEKNPEQYITPVDIMFEEYEKITVEGETEKRILNGCTVPANVESGKIYRIYGKDGRFLCLSEGVGEGKTCLKLKKAFFNS